MGKGIESNFNSIIKVVGQLGLVKFFHAVNESAQSHLVSDFGRNILSNPEFESKVNEAYRKAIEGSNKIYSKYGEIIFDIDANNQLHVLEDEEDLDKHQLIETK